MSIQKMQNRDSLGNSAIINNIVSKALCKMQNGSITIVKQDNTVIQINVNEKIDFENQIINEDFVKGAIL